MTDHRNVPGELPGFREAPLDELRDLLTAAGMFQLAECVGRWGVPSIISVAVRQSSWNAALADWLRRWGEEQKP